ncbi:MAG: PQQ-like beta-propeller repeat protein [Draconibacterium sp.]|nr:PQQ-like beta-propeller repeat protein [Draconibacterium sp.]
MLLATILNLHQLSIKGKVVIGSTDGFVYCLDTNGKQLWKFETGNAIEASALIHENVVYIGNLDGTCMHSI